LKFHLGPEGYKRRCTRCGAVVRLADGIPNPAPEKPPIPEWTYAQTEQMRSLPADANLDVTAWVKTASSPPLPPPAGEDGSPPPLPMPARQVEMPAMEMPAWTDVEAVPVPPGMPWAKLAGVTGLMLVAVSVAIGLLIHYLRGGMAPH
jgi:hypothetical protein